MKIAIDAGHGPQTPGKRCPDDSMREFTFNSVTAGYVFELLKEYEGIEIIKVYEPQRDVPLKERTDRANAWNAAIFISIHANASGNEWSDAHGIETFVYTEASKASIALAGAVQRNLIQSTGLSDRGVKKDNLHVVRETKMPAILVECGFMTNHTEAELLKSDVYRRKCATAIVKGVAETYGLKHANAEEQPVKMDTNGELPTIRRRVDVSVDNGPKETGYLIEGVTYVPIRIISEAFGASVDWNNGSPVKITKEVK